MINQPVNSLKRMSYFFLPIPFAAVAVEQDRPIRIGYSECIAVANFPRSTVEKIGQLKWYFAHASVGANMMDGVTDLHALGADVYPLKAVSAQKTPPASTQPGGI